MLFDFIVGAMIAAALYCLLRGIKKKLLCPVPMGKNISITTVIELRGPAPELEETVRALNYLNGSLKLKTEICIRDRGADEETAAVAAMLAGDGTVRMIE